MPKTKTELLEMGEDAARLYVLRCLWGACRSTSAYEAIEEAVCLLEHRGQDDLAKALKKIAKASGKVIDFEYNLIVIKDRNKARRAKGRRANQAQAPSANTKEGSQ